MPARVDPALIPPSPTLEIELSFWKAGLPLVAGLDEAGRGAWAGPVCAAAVIFPPFFQPPAALSAVRDSKQLSAAQRGALAPLVREHALTCAVGFSTCGEIDALGILPATRLAMSRALEQLGQQPQHLLLDALFLPDDPLPQTALIKGDQRSLSIAAASILAKTARDEWMVRYAEEDPRYGFTWHKGYGTRSHQSALAAHGPCPQHRKSYAPIRNLLNKDTGAD